MRIRDGKKIFCYIYFKFVLGTHIWLNDYREQGFTFFWNHFKFFLDVSNSQGLRHFQCLNEKLETPATCCMKMIRLFRE